MNGNYRRTLYASYLGYIVQAVINNFAPLLFLTFQREFSLSLEQIGFLVTYNFSVQIVVDLLAARYVDRIGYRRAVVGAHIFSAAGLMALAVFPEWFPSPYMGMLAALTLSSVGGGLIEVLISPLVEALPTKEKASAMSLLHSFYCWGHVFVVLASTLFFRIVGIGYWRYLAAVWALVPFVNIFLFAGAPVCQLDQEEDAKEKTGIFSTKLFWLFFLLMICSGASEQAMSQWSSFFAESGLKVSKTVGDLLGPCMFAILMGISRTFYGRCGEKIPLKRFLTISSIGCVASYLLAVFAPHPALALAGCGLCGLSVGIMWPGTFSLAARHCPQGGTAMFALLALAGDVGCAGGPSVVGMISERMGGSLKAGLLAAAVFPAALLITVQFLRTKKRKTSLTCL